MNHVWRLYVVLALFVLLAKSRRLAEQPVQFLYLLVSHFWLALRQLDFALSLTLVDAWLALD